MNDKFLKLKSNPLTKPKKKLFVRWDVEDLNKSTIDVFKRMDKPQTLGKKFTPKRVGYWRGVPREKFTGGFVTDYPDCPIVQDFIDPKWESTERDMVIKYLKTGVEKDRYRGYSTCRICGKHNNGDSCLTDNTWVWPEGLAHYLEEHNVKPPQEFIEWVKKQTHQENSK